MTPSADIHQRRYRIDKKCKKQQKEGYKGEEIEEKRRSVSSLNKKACSNGG